MLVLELVGERMALSFLWPKVRGRERGRLKLLDKELYSYVMDCIHDAKTITTPSLLCTGSAM